VISRDRFLEIEGKIRTEEKEKLRKREASIRETLQQQFAAEYEKKTQASEKRLQVENGKTLAKVIAERDAAARKLKEAEAREIDIRKVAKAEAEKAAAKELEKQNRAVERLTAERDVAARKVEEAEAREAEIRKEVKREAERAGAKELQKQRELLEKDRDAALLRKQAEFGREREVLQSKLKVMERRLQGKTANQLGDGAEIDLYEALRESFTEDRITRVPKGQNGADLIHEVRYKGQCCGKIVIDSKNRQSWQNGFVSKLREDQFAADADHAILATSVFPSGKKEMCVESDVIVVNPARVVYVIQVLRRSIISMYVLGLSLDERADKTNRLYKLITSDDYVRRFGEAVKLTERILDLDVEEEKAHTLVWRNRGALTKRMGNLLREIDTDVAAVIEGSDSGVGDVAAQSKLPPTANKPVHRREAI
jgi:hypothetical protein